MSDKRGKYAPRTRKNKVRPPEDRFWKRVSMGREDECWNWVGKPANQFKHGNFFMDGKNMTAHRFAYRIATGFNPEGMDVAHICGNMRCVNPRHLRAQRRGERILAAAHPSAVSTPEQVEEMRALKEQGLGYSEIARRVGLAYSTTRHLIVHGYQRK
jgi:hypothetical protein